MSFLSSLLPTIIGGALTVATDGAVTPLESAALVGGGSYLMNPNKGLLGGLMTGLSAYGGSTLAGGITPNDLGFTSGAATSPGEITAPPSAGGLAGPAPQGITSGMNARDDLLLNSGAGTENARDALLARSVPPDQITSQLANTTMQDTGPSAFDKLKSNIANNKMIAAGAIAPAALSALQSNNSISAAATPNQQQVAPFYRYNPGMATPTPAANQQGRENNYFPTAGYQQISRDDARSLYGYAEGGDIQSITDAAAVGGNGNFPQSRLPQSQGDYAQATQTPISQNPMMASGGLSDARYNLGGYSDGGRLLKGPGDGVSDSIPATIGHKQPARLADGEFVVPARIVSELGNGSTDAGARKLYAMMDRVQKTRGKTVGKNRVATNSRADKYLPA